VSTHEAGHVFGAWVGGLVVQQVTICGPRRVVNGQDSFAYTEILSPGTGALQKGQAFDDPTCEGYVLMGLLPILIEERAGHVISKHDSELLMNFLSFGSCLNGGRDTIRAAFQCAESPDGPKRFFQSQKNKLERVLQNPRSMRCIEILGSELEGAGRLSGSRAVQVLEIAWGDPLPEKAIPSGQHGLDYKPRSVPEAIKSVKQMAAMCREVLADAKPKNDTEEALINRIEERLLGIHFDF
jgi:hypothetical protein